MSPGLAESEREVETSDQFKRAEDEYNRLKGLVASGRMTQEQFEATLKQLVVQDAQGQYWAMGDNGYWVKREGPPPRAMADSNLPPTAPATTAKSFQWAIVVPIVALCLVLLCGLGVGGLVLRAVSSAPSLAQAATATATVTVAQASTAAPTAAPTDRPSPTATLAPTETASPTPTETASPTPTETASPTPTATVAITPSIYVTGLRLDPPAPTRRQDVQFYVSILNTTNSAANLRLVVLIFKPENLKNSLGQTTATRVNIPIGREEQKLEGWKLNGGAGCENFLAQVAFIEGKKVTYLTSPNGPVFELPFSVC